jgi:DNA-directed RNA polymerase subunit K/omega
MPRPERPGSTLSPKGGFVIVRPAGTNSFEFVILASLRSAQLMRGCIPRVVASHKAVITAQREVAEGKVIRAPEVETP